MMHLNSRLFFSSPLLDKTICHIPYIFPAYLVHTYLPSTVPNLT
jgi:hypothetical protein